MYKMAGFTNKTNLKIISGSTSPLSTARSIFIPEENYKIFMNKSTPIDTVNYSAVIVQRVTMVNIKIIFKTYFILVLHL